MRKILPLSVLLSLLFAMTPLIAMAADPTDTTDTSAAPASDTADPNAAASPGSDAPFQFKRQGVFDCNPNGAYSQSIGALGATGGVYVPVADATVELNTGILVYKECILREIVDRERESATSAFLKQLTQAIQKGRDGNAQYVQNQAQEELAVTDKARLQGLQGGALSTMNPVIRSTAERYAAQAYMAQTRNSASALACPYNDLQNALQGSPNNIWDALKALENPACSPLYGSYMADEALSAQENLALRYQRDQWNWGRGYYSRVTCTSQDPLSCTIVTPAAVVEQSFQQVLGSGYRQLENADDVGQMVGALFAGLGNQIIGSAQGLSGISQSFNGQPSYLDQVAAESATGLRNAAGNAALQILSAARQIEAGFLQAATDIATALKNSITQLRTTEAKCWDLIIQKECATPLAADNTCTEVAGECTTDPVTGAQTCPVGGQLKIATSTAFSQSIITAQIAPFATTTAANITTSTTALKILDQLIAGVTNTTSLDAQRLALQQVDQLVATRALHTQQNLNAIQQQSADLKAQMNTLVQDTVKAWADSTDVNVGWCNVNNPSVIQYWDQKWKI